MIILLLLILQFSNINHALKPGIGKKQQKFAYIDGDFIVGALFPVHERPSREFDSDPLVCGKINEEYGIQGVEAALFAIDIINKDSELLPGIKLGINIKDDFWSESIALNQALKLMQEPAVVIKDSSAVKSNNLEKYNDKSAVGIKDSSSVKDTNSEENRDEEYDSLLIGIIGPASSSATIQVQNPLKLFKVPQIGYSATSMEFYDESPEYPYFGSIVPFDINQVFLLLRIMKKFNWAYMSIVYTDNNYGQRGVKQFLEWAPVFQICIGQIVPIQFGRTEVFYDIVLNHLTLDKKAKVVVCFCEGPDVRGILKSMKRHNATGMYQFLGSDGWASQKSIVEDYYKQALGSITIGLDTIMIKEFDEYYLQLNPENNQRNPWFREFWEQKFKCQVTPTHDKKSILPKCTGNEKLEKRSADDFKVSNVIKAIFTFAYALHDMQRNVCPNETAGPCDDLYPFNTTKFMGGKGGFTNRSIILWMGRRESKYEKGVPP